MIPSLGVPADVKSSSPFNNIKMRGGLGPTAANPLDESPIQNRNGNGNNGSGSSNGNGIIDRDIIDRINGVKAASKSPSKRREKEMGKDEFLKLLTFQLQNQDPSNPMDDKKMTSELAQFSQLEQLAGLKSIMEKQQGNRALEQKYYASNLLGKKVATEGSLINHNEEGAISPVRFSLSEDVKKAIIRIYDTKGNMISDFEKEDLPKGSHELLWNGKNLDGTYAEKGMYRFEVRAFNESYMPVEVETKVAGIVRAVEVDGDVTTLTIDKQKVDLREVSSFELDEKLMAKDIKETKDINEKNENKNFQGNPNDFPWKKIVEQGMY